MNLGSTIRVNPVRTIILVSVIVLSLLYMFSSYGRKPKASHLHVSQNYETGGRVSLRTLLSVAIEAAERGGKQVKKVREGADIDAVVKGKTKEGKDELTTKGDSLSNLYMFYTIKNVYPSIKLISEEKERDTVRMPEIQKASGQLAEVLSVVKEDENVPISDITVWIDPLDATEEYKDKLLQYVTTMVCVTVKGKPVIGVIHKPFENKTAWAWVDHGHALYLKASTREGTGDRFIVSRSHPGEVKSMLEKKFGSETIITVAGGAGYKTLEVLQGKEDAYVHLTRIKKWDICAGNAIMNYFGGQVKTLKGDDLDYSANSNPISEDGLLVFFKDRNSYRTKLADVKVR